MCSRYKLNSKPFELKNRFKLDKEPIIRIKPEQYPSDQSLIIDLNGPKYSNWGLSVDWTSGLIINARAETLTNKKAFSQLLMSRCLVPARYYYEWAKNQNGKKRKYSIKAIDQKIMAFAGLIDRVSNSFVIITCSSSMPITHIHHRMPVILNPSLENKWLDCKSEIGPGSCFFVPYTKVSFSAQSAPALP